MGESTLATSDKFHLFLTTPIFFAHFSVYRGDRGKAPPNSPWNDDDWLEVSVQKMLDMENQPITGIASCWDYERGGWKKGKPQAFRDPMLVQGNEFNSWMGWEYNPF